ncbi:MAG: hypothetical protein WA919_08970 [Coleofasciculaceae cyanobacterium]
MENVNETIYTPENKVEKRNLQPSLVLQALAFTGILYFGFNPTSASNIRTTQSYQSVQTRATPLAPVSDAVLQDASQQSGLPISDLYIVDARQRTWSNSCLELGETEASCTQTLVPGWQVTIANGQKRWLYRTNASGTLLKLDNSTFSPSQQREQTQAKSPLLIK